MSWLGFGRGDLWELHGSWLGGGSLKLLFWICSCAEFGKLPDSCTYSQINVLASDYEGDCMLLLYS